MHTLTQECVPCGTSALVRPPRFSGNVSLCKFRICDLSSSDIVFRNSCRGLFLYRSRLNSELWDVRDERGGALRYALLHSVHGPECHQPRQTYHSHISHILLYVSKTHAKRNVRRTTKHIQRESNSLRAKCISIGYRAPDNASTRSTTSVVDCWAYFSMRFLYAPVLRAAKCAGRAVAIVRRHVYRVENLFQGFYSFFLSFIQRTRAFHHYHRRRTARAWRREWRGSIAARSRRILSAVGESHGGVSLVTERWCGLCARCSSLSASSWPSDIV